MCKVVPGMGDNWMIKKIPSYAVVLIVVIFMFVIAVSATRGPITIHFGQDTCTAWTWVCAIHEWQTLLAAAFALLGAWLTIRKIQKQIDLSRWDHAIKEIDSLERESREVPDIAKKVQTFMMEFPTEEDILGKPQNAQNWLLGTDRKHIAKVFSAALKDISEISDYWAGGQKVHNARERLFRKLKSGWQEHADFRDHALQTFQGKTNFTNMRPFFQQYKTEVGENFGEGAYKSRVATAFALLQYQRALANRIKSLKSRYDID